MSAKKFLLPFALAWALAASLFAAPARADSPFDGKWRQGPLKEEYTVQKWLSACGPPPVSGSSGGGETISVHEEGDELAFVGGGRVYRSNQCYDQMPTLARDAHSRDASGRSWRTRCVTPPSDPRHALIQTLVVGTTDTHIDVIETGRYEISISDGRCVADVKRSRGFDLIAADNGTPAATATSAPPPTPKPVDTRCSSPGDPARLEVRPSRKLMRAGDSFAFRAVVLDANGCGTRTATSWALADGTDAAGATLDAGGKLTVPPDAPEGTFDIVVTAAGKSAHVTVEIASASRYDELLAQSGLNDAGESDIASVALIATGSIGGGEAQGDPGKRRRTIFLGIVGGVSLALLAVAIVGWRRSRKAATLAREAEERHAERVREAEERNRERAAQHAAAQRAHDESLARAAAEATSGPSDRLVCPSCRREYPMGTTYCPSDSNRLVPIKGHEEMLAGPSGGICPVCHRGFDPGVKACPQDGEELIPYALYASRNPATAGAPAPKGKICPTCGGRFEGNAAFCGKDGTALVLLN